jgi:predicted CopG family antitoxin
MMGDDTTIRIKTATWSRLRDRKGPGESFDEVITQLLDHAEGCAETPVDA